MGTEGSAEKTVGWTSEGKPQCLKCQTVVTVWGTNASHAFHLREGEKERRAAGKKGEKGERRGVAQGSGQQPPKPKSMPKPLERMVELVPDLAALEPPTWYNEAWWAICRRGTAIEDLDVSIEVCHRAVRK